MYNHDLERVDQEWSGCTNVSGKLSDHVANGTKQRMKLFFKSDQQQLNGICVDSGQGIPESLSKCLSNLNLLSQYFSAASCGLHDIQSVLCLPIFGSGGLDSDDAIQAFHTMYAFYTEKKAYWSDIMKGISFKMGYTEATTPKHLEKSMQVPLTTRW